MADTSLQWRYLRPSGSKVKCIEFHPMQPWLGIADEAGNVSVWDLHTQQLVYETKLATPDEVTFEDAMLQRAAEREPDYFGPHLSHAMHPPKVKVSSGAAVKDMQFCDDETAFWQMASQHSQLHHAYSGSCHPHLGKVGGLRGHRWLVLAIDAKVVIQDMISGQAREAPRPLWGNKDPTALAFLYANAARLLGFDGGSNANEVILGPVMAVGSTTGATTLLNFITLQVYAKLVGGHKGAVTALLPLGSVAPGGPDRLLSAGADGTIAVWEPSTAGRGGAGVHSPVATWKAHDGAITGLTFYRHLGDTPEQPPIKLATAGEDKKVLLWDTDKWKLISSIRALPKGNVDALMFSCHGSAAFGEEPCLLLASQERPALWGLHPGTGAVTQLLAMEHLIPPGHKKVPKVYTAACHPTLPHLLAVAANSGVAILTFDAYDTPPVALLPLRRSTAEEAGEFEGGLLDDPAAGGDGGLDELEAVLDPDGAAARAAAQAAAEAAEGHPQEAGVTLLGGLVDSTSKGQAYLTVVGKALWAVFYRTSSRDGWAGPQGPRQLTAELASREVIARLPHAGKPHLACSASGRCISVVWPHVRHYIIWMAGEGGTWTQLTDGVATHLVWATKSSTFAVLYAPDAQMPDLGPVSKKKAKAREEEQARAAAVAEAQLRAHQATSVQVYEVDESSRQVVQVSALVDTGSERPIRLHAGPLLGIAFTSTITNGSRTGNALQFYSWGGSQQPVGPQMVEPKWLAWDPQVTLCALAYEDAVTLAVVRPEFRAFASLPIRQAVSGVWRTHQLFLLTPDSLVVAFAAAGGGSGRIVGLGGTNQPFLEIVPLASLQGAVAESENDAGALPGEGMRPGGPAAVLGPRDGNLWLADALGQPFLVPLTAPGLRARCKAALNKLEEAREQAEMGLVREHHDEVARFLAALQPEGAAEAQKLPGLSLSAELSLAIQRGQYTQALRCLEALAAGHTERAAIAAMPALPQQESEPAAVDPVTALDSSIEALYGPPGLPPPGMPGKIADSLAAEQPNFLSMRKAGYDSDDSDASDVSAESEGGTIDWDVPLKLPRSVLLAAKQAQAAQEAATNSTFGTAAASIAAAADQALQLAAAANSANETEVARGALRIVAAGAAGLATEQVIRVLLEMARAGMAREADSLAALLSAPGARKAPQVVALAAAIAQDPLIVQETLQSSGLVALASLYTHAWRAGNALNALNEWTRQLETSSGDPDARVTIQAPTAMS
mmetsp:Transcript_12197/g.36597  ORF Transcript_12197/g.36597 Transcript_12197/m.36597 type:complete len:1238 (-) Transcript_12197:225-3938(-)